MIYCCHIRVEKSGWREKSVALSWKMESCRKRWGRASSAMGLPVCSAGRKRRSEPQGKGCIWSLMSRSQAATFSSALFVFTGLSVSTPWLFCLVGPTVVLRLSACYLSSDCPVFFLCLEFIGLNIISPSFSPSHLHCDSQWFSATSVRRDRLGVFPIALTFWLWSNECNANRM